VVNATALVLIPVMALFARRRAVWILLGAAVAIAPVALRNWVQGGELVLISYNAGINLFVGNNARYDETVAMRPGRDWQALLRAPRLHGAQGARAASRHYVGRVLEFATSDPHGFVRLQLKKARLLLSGNEIPRNQEIYPARAYSPVLRALLWKVPFLAFPFGVLLPLGVLGLAVGIRRAPMLAAMLLTLTLVVLAFFITARYRVPLVPVLLVFAAEGARWFVSSASRPARAVTVMLLLPLFALVNLGQGSMPTRMTPDAEFGLAAWLEREGRTEEALALYRAVAWENPGYWDAWHRLGQILDGLGRRDEAAQAFRAAREAEPEHVDTLIFLADTRARAGCLEEAAEYYEKALMREPSHPLARANLQRLLTETAKGTTAGAKEACIGVGAGSPVPTKKDGQPAVEFP